MHARTPARPLTTLLAALVAALALALAASGCGSAAESLDPVARAAEATSRAGGAHLALSVQVSADGLASPLQMSGQGFFNYTRHEGRLSLQMSGLPAGAVAGLPGGSVSIEEILKSSTIYVGSGLFASKLPGGARWMKLDLARVGQSIGLNFQQLIGGQSNPAALLEYLKAGGGGVEVVGHDAVRGVPTTRYRGAIDLSKVADTAPSALRAQLRAAIAKLTAQTGLHSIPVEVWIDAQRLVRRVAIAVSLPASAASAQAQITLELFGFGPTPAVAAPAPGEVFDATAAALSGLGAGGG